MFVTTSYDLPPYSMVTPWPILKASAGELRVRLTWNLMSWLLTEPLVRMKRLSSSVQIVDPFFDFVLFRLGVIFGRSRGDRLDITAFVDIGPIDTGTYLFYICSIRVMSNHDAPF